MVKSGMGNGDSEGGVSDIRSYPMRQRLAGSGRSEMTGSVRHGG